MKDFRQYLTHSGANGISFNGPQLDMKDWAKVKAVIEGIGGIWHTKTQTWIFPYDVSRLFNIIKAKDFKFTSFYHFFETPLWLIDSYMSYRFQQMGGLYIDGAKVLEPSAGRGQIYKFLDSWGMKPDVCELAPENCEILKTSTGSLRLRMIS